VALLHTIPKLLKRCPVRGLPGEYAPIKYPVTPRVESVISVARNAEFALVKLCMPSKKLHVRIIDESIGPSKLGGGGLVSVKVPSIFMAVVYRGTLPPPMLLAE